MGESNTDFELKDLMNNMSLHNDSDHMHSKITAETISPKGIGFNEPMYFIHNDYANYGQYYFNTYFFSNPE
jgi:hypothetical protein